MYKLSFCYNKLGFGALCIWKSGRLEECFPCRTGSINMNGKLVNAIPTGTWTAFELTLLPESHRDVEPPLFVKVDGVWFGFKLRLRTPAGAWSHYLIHPDGNKPGSEGCIVSLNRHIALFSVLSKIMKVTEVLPVEVNK